MDTHYSVNIRFYSKKEKNKFIKQFKAEKAKAQPPLIDGHLTVETVQVQHVWFPGESREVSFCVGVPVGELEKVIQPGDWTVVLDFIPDDLPGVDIPPDLPVVQQVNMHMAGTHRKRFTTVVTDPNWVRLWDAAEVLFRESGDFHRYFEGIDIDHEHRVIRLVMGS